MKKMLVLSVLLAAFAWSSTSYGVVLPTKCLVYKGAIQASNSIFDVNHVDTLVSGTIQGYWAVYVVDSGPYKGYVMDSNAVLYSAKDKYYKVIPYAMRSDPCDPCHVVLLNFSAMDIDGGSAWFAVIGKSKLTKYSNDTGAAKDFIPTGLKGGGLLTNFDFFNTDYAFTGPVTVSLTLDTKWTQYANTGSYNAANIINDIVAGLTSKGGWTNWPYYLVIE